MKIFSILLLGSGAIIGLYLVLRPTASSSLIEKNPKPETAAVSKKRFQPPNGKESYQSPAAEASVSATAMSADETKPKVIPDPPIVTTTHFAQDFNWGEFNNTVLEETVRLSSKAAPFSGTYVSLAQLRHRAFDSITMDYKAEIPPGSSLKFELQTKASDEHWSEWQEIELHNLRKPIPTLEATAGWRYRFTFSAPSVETSPRVQSVTITTQNSTLLAEGPNDALANKTAKVP